MAISRWLKRLSICMVCLLVAVGLLIGYLRIFSGAVLQSASNRKGTVTAEVIDGSGSSAATDVGYLGVAMKTRFNPIRHYVFGGSNYGVQIQVSWINDHVLKIRCDSCEKLQGGNILEHRWHQVTICYDDSIMMPLPQEAEAVCLNRPGSMASESNP